MVSSIEKATSNVPVLGSAAHLAGIGLHGLHNVANMGQSAGSGLTLLGQGNVKGALNAGKQIINQGKSTLALGGDVAKTGGRIVQEGAPLMAFL